MFARRAIGVVSLAAFGVFAAAAHRPPEASPADGTQQRVSVDPPAFGVVPVAAGQTIRASIVCYQHQVGRIPPGPCRGTIMLHDVAGNVVRQGTYDLQPGQVGGLSFTFAPVATNAAVTILINPCWLPAPGGRGIPSVEVVDATGRVVQFVNPAAARFTDLSDGSSVTDPGSLVGFNPIPEPPGFGFITFSRDQSVRLHVSCSAHPVGVETFAPPCRGVVMFHDAAGTMVDGATYDLKPGETATIALMKLPPPDPDFRGDSGINPCWIPAAGGHAVPIVEIADATGATAHLINPAVARLSDLDQ